MIRFFKLIFLILLALIVAIFAANNNQAVSLDLYPVPVQFEISLFIIVFACMMFGVLIAGTLTSLRLMYWKRVAKNSQKTIAKLEKLEKK
jgi:uncharacterized integral membrane protein